LKIFIDSKVIFLFIFICFNSFPQDSFINKGTTIIAVVRNDTVWIGADSKVTDEDGNFVGTTCKILRYNDIVFAHAGLKTDFVADIDIENIFISSYFRNKTLSGTVKTFGDSLMLAIDRANRNSKIGMEYEIGDTIKTHIVEAYFAGVENDTLKLFVYLIVPWVGVLHRNGIVFSPYLREVSAQQSSFIPVFGGYANKIRYIGDIFKSGDVPQLIRAMILIECAKESKFVGEPINIIRITKNGIEWIENQNCK
jgi:hypothetical protein